MGTQASKLSIRQNNKVEKTAKSATLPTSAQSQNTLEEFIQRAVDNPGEHTLTPAVVQTLQRTHGNHFVQRLVAQARQKNAARGKTSKADLKVTPRGSGFVQRLAYDDPPASWNADAVRRSGEGVAGVFFVDKGPDTVVVKPLDDPGNVEFANKFMEEGMGFEAPQTMSYAKTSGDGTTIKDLLVANKHVGRTPDEVETQIAGANYFVVMDMVAGKSIQRLDDNEAMGFITDANALKDVGRLMMADAFLGNTDRLVGGNVNLGNFFYAAAGTINAKVTTIDNDSKFQQGAFSAKGNLTGNLDSKMHLMESLMDNNQRIGWINAFIAKFKQIHQNNNQTLAAMDDNFVRTNVSAGIDAGLQDLADVFKNNIDLVRSLKDVNEKYGASDNRDVSAAKGLAQYVEEREGGTTKGNAVNKLKNYVKYRTNRTKAPKGFKWAVKLFSNTGF